MVMDEKIIIIEELVFDRNVYDAVRCYYPKCQQSLQRITKLDHDRDAHKNQNAIVREILKI